MNGVEIAFIPTILFAKNSILLLYIRLFVPGKGGGWRNKTKTWWIIQSVIMFNALFYIANLPIEIWPCIPRRKLWMPSIPGSCINNEAVFVAGGSINMVVDFMILAIPIVSVWRLKMSIRRRIGVSAIFATGILYAPSSPCPALSKLIPTQLLHSLSHAPRNLHPRRAQGRQNLLPLPRRSLDHRRNHLRHHVLLPHLNAQLLPPHSAKTDLAYALPLSSEA